MMENNPGKNNPICQECGLWESCNSPFMEYSGHSVPDVLIVGEAPGEWEDKEGVPFVGTSGRKLREVLEASGITEYKVAFSNVVRCRPPENDTKAEHITHCEGFLKEEIKVLDPDVVMLMGNTPLGSVLGKTGITTWNGVVVERDDRMYVPLLHPAYILRNRAAMDDWLEGMLNVVDALEGKVYSEEDKLDYHYPKTVADVLDMREYLKDCEWIAYDTETTTLDAFMDVSDIIAVSFAGGDRTYALPMNHPENWWTDDEYFQIVDVVKEILVEHGHHIIGHNMKFDWVWTKKHLGFEYETGADTMLMHNLIDTRQGIHGLKRLAGLYLGMYDYDRELMDYIKKHSDANVYKGGSYAFVPLDVLLPYAAMDTHATLLLYFHFIDMLTDKQRALHDEALTRISDWLSRTEYNGFKLDDYIANRYYKVYKTIRDEKYREILKDPGIQKAINIEQRENDMDVIADMFEMYGLIGKEEKKTIESYMDHFEITENKIIAKGPAKKRIKTINHRKHTTRSRDVFEFNPNSDYHLRTFLFDVHGMNPIELTEKMKVPSVKSDILEVYQDDIPIVEQILDYKLLNSMLSKYLEPAVTGEWKSGDGLVRCDYNINGTKTGRLASSDPNLHNIPTPESNPDTLLEILPIKNVFTSRYENGVLVAVDYSGMELRVFASISKCVPMLEIHRSGQDFHTMVASMVSGIPYDEIKKSVRYVYKWTNWTLLYGGSAYTLHSMYDIPMDQAEDVVQKYYQRFPEVLDYQEDCVAFAENRGYIESVFGRRLYLYYINDHSEVNKGRRNKDRRTAINMPIQSAASDVTMLAGGVLDKELIKYDLNKTLSVNTVHDSIVLDTTLDEVDRAVELSIDVMENIQEYARSYYPSLDLSWIACPLSADAEVGTHWGNKVPYRMWLEETHAKV